ncbi:MAG TPA: N-6 DNA methylase [Caldisericia bacterium]|nr:N-6 DNA methylase [Caldisericia bacterium]
MSNELKISKSSKEIKEYFKAIEKQVELGQVHEGAVQPLFSSLLRSLAKGVGWEFTTEKVIKDTGKRPDGAFIDTASGLEMGIWEAKDDRDDLEQEVINKFKIKYPKKNIIFWQPKRIIIYQNTKVFDDEIANNPDKLTKALEIFFSYTPPHLEEWKKAVEEFKERVPELSAGLLSKIEQAKTDNKKFIDEFENFRQLCLETINPNISDVAIEEMLIQHLLTERIIRQVFSNPDFTNNNAIANQLEQLAKALFSGHFNRAEFLGKLDFIYRPIESVAADITDYSEKQAFINNMYERFFQGWAVKTADKLGIVYTPQPVVDFMVKSVESILKREFGKSLSSKGVHILDPFVGTGNFILRVMREIDPLELPKKYESELHCNEISLMPYYVASMNIEHEYLDLMPEGTRYKPFEGICFADTFQMFEDEQKFAFMTKENAIRVKRQRDSDIFVIITNPPYNAHQMNENDNNKNRAYPELEKEIRDTYSKDSRATLRNALSDPYVKAIKWASKRIGTEGIVAMITNNSFVDGYALDGMRKHLEQDFDKIVHVNLRGNARTSGEKRRKEKGNIFEDAIRVGVGITFFIRSTNNKGNCVIEYAEVGDYLTSEQKKEYLESNKEISIMKLKQLEPNENHTWLTEGMAEDFEQYPMMGDKEQKGKKDCEAIFNLYSRGVATSRDNWAYNYHKPKLEEKMKLLINTYNKEVDRWDNTDKTKFNNLKSPEKMKIIDEFVEYDETKIQWDGFLKEVLIRGIKRKFSDNQIRNSVYRPYTREYLYFDPYLNNRRYQQHNFFPTPQSEKENKVICVSGIGSSKPFHSSIVNIIPCLDMLEKTQSFPFYTYSPDGTNRQENITDWAHKLYQKHYKDTKITKWDIFYYIYAMLHHPSYKEDYKENLRRSLPRVPYAPNFWKFAEIGKSLADIHINYEQAKEYELDRQLDKEAFKIIGYKVDKMKLNRDKTELEYNKAITFTNIPKEVFNYKLGNRSALEWIVDQYRVKVDKRSGIVQDPNNFDGNPRYIFELVGKIVTVSLETVKLVNELRKLEYK